MQPRITRLLVVAAAICGTTAAYANATVSTQRFTLTTKTVNGKDDSLRVIAAGPIHGTGTVQLKSSQDKRVDHMTLHLPNGTVYLVAAEKSFAVHPNLRKCIATSTGQGTFTIDGGTNDFQGVHGHGTYQRHGILIGARNANGTCLGRKAPPKATSSTIVMTGTAQIARG